MSRMKVSASRRNVLIVFCFAISTGFAQSKTTPPPQEPPKPLTAPTAGIPGGVPAAVDPRSYQIGPEDVLAVRVWRQPDFTNNYVVRPDGRISIPLIGDVQAAGLTPDRLAGQIKQALTAQIIDPQVTIEILQVNSKKIYVMGEVNRPGPQALVVPTTALEALGNAGGFRDFANETHILILREGKQLKFNYKDVTHGKHLEQNILLQNGDTIIVH